MKHLALALALVAQPLAAWSHDLARGPNGGPVVDSAGHHVEMVAQGIELVFYLMDEGDKPTGARPGARAIVQQGGRTATVPLNPSPPNRLFGTLPAPLDRGARVVVSATLADGHAVQARFVKD